MKNAIKISFLAASGIWLAACSGDQEQSSRQVNPVSVVVTTPSSSGGNIVSVSGQIQSQQTAVISTRVMGFVQKVLVENGQSVKQGQLLATINSDDILAKRAQATAMVQEAEAALAQAKKDYDRFTELYKQQSASSKEYENITLHYQSLKSKAEAAKQMQREADAMLAYTNLTAPFAGVVVQKNIDAGSMANPGMPLFVIEQPGSYEVKASVQEQDIAKIKKGNKAMVTLKANGKVVDGVVKEVSPSSSFSGGQYALTITIPQKETSDFYSGMTVHVSIVTSGASQKEESVRIPAEAVIYHDQLTGIYTVTDKNTALLHWIRLGKKAGNEVEVLSGLTAQEPIILTAEGKLYNGAPVKVTTN